MSDFIFGIGCFIVALIIVGIPLFTIPLWKRATNRGDELMVPLLLLLTIGTIFEVITFTVLIYRYFRG